MLVNVNLSDILDLNPMNGHASGGLSAPVHRS